MYLLIVFLEDIPLQGFHYYSRIRLCIQGKQITQVSTIMFLGVMIDEKLNLKAHVSYISGKISRAIGVITKARNLGKEALLSLYYILIYPYLTYCHHVWGSTYQYNIDTLKKIQKKAVRIICSANPFSHTEKLYDELKILTIRDIYCYPVGQLMFRFCHKLLPRIFDK